MFAYRLTLYLLILQGLMHSVKSCGPGGFGGGIVKTFLDNTQVSPYTGVSLGQQAIIASQLNCDFSTNCMWYNLPRPESQFDWQVGRFRTTTDPILNSLWTNAVGKAGVPNGDFLFAGRAIPGSGFDTAVLAANVQCQRGQGQLQFNAWTNDANLRLQVCVQAQYSQGGKTCQSVTTRTDPNPIRVPINGPPSFGPFQIRIEASGFSDAGIIVIDDLYYTGDLCGQNAPFATSSGVGCQQLECDFSQGNTCAYERRPNAAQWNVAGGKIGNPILGPRGGPGSYDLNPSYPTSRRLGQNSLYNNPSSLYTGNYAYVGSDTQPQQQYVLQSPSFQINNPATLEFDLFTRSSSPVLRVCLDDPNAPQYPFSSVQQPFQSVQPFSSVQQPFQSSQSFSSVQQQPFQSVQPFSSVQQPFQPFQPFQTGQPFQQQFLSSQQSFVSYANCPYNSKSTGSFTVRVQQPGWSPNRQRVPIPPGRYRVSFVAENMRQNDYIAIDNIRFNPQPNPTDCSVLFG